MKKAMFSRLLVLLAVVFFLLAVGFFLLAVLLAFSCWFLLVGCWPSCWPVCWLLAVLLAVGRLVGRLLAFGFSLLAAGIVLLAVGFSLWRLRIMCGWLFGHPGVEFRHWHLPAPPLAPSSRDEAGPRPPPPRLPDCVWVVFPELPGLTVK